MLMTIGNSLRCRARRKRNRTLPRSRCGRTPPYEPPSKPSKTRSDVRKAKVNSRAKGRQHRLRINNSRTRDRMIHPKASSLVLGMIIVLEDKGVSDSWGVFSRRQATSRSSLH